MEGFLLIDKAKGLSSFAVVSIIRRLLGVKKVGHGGTLDPLATGLLIIAFGKATKLLGNLLGADKKYQVTARFGAVSDTYDAEGKIEEINDKVISRQEIEDLIKAEFLGEINQMPPVFSALKVNGKRAYELARRGQEVKLEARKVHIYDFKILNYAWPLVSFEVSCGSGTYIRSLIHDIGAAKGCGAYVEELRRTEVGPFFVDDAVFVDVVEKEGAADYILTVEDFLQKIGK